MCLRLLECAVTRERLAELATAALGPRWQRALARRLINPQTGRPMNERTVRRYASGELPVPDFVEIRLRELRRERLIELGAVPVKRQAAK